MLDKGVDFKVKRNEQGELEHYVRVGEHERGSSRLKETTSKEDESV